jgi:hypothetical protein
MAGSASDYLENKLIDHSLGTTVYTKPSSVYIALYTTAPSDSYSGVEVSGGSYIRKIITFSSASGGSAVNNTAVSFTSMPTADVSGIGVLDSLTSGNLLYWGTLSNTISIISGDTVNISNGTLTISLS